MKTIATTVLILTLIWILVTADSVLAPSQYLGLALLILASLIARAKSAQIQRFLTES